MADQINIALNQLLSNNFVSSAVTLGLSFYAYKAGPALPSFMEELFENVFFQIFVGFMVLYMNTQNVMLSLVVSAVFVYGMKMFTGLKEGMTNEKCEKNTEIKYCKNRDIYDMCKVGNFVKYKNDPILTKKFNDIINELDTNYYLYVNDKITEKDWQQVLNGDNGVIQKIKNLKKQHYDDYDEFMKKYPQIIKCNYEDECNFLADYRSKNDHTKKEDAKLVNLYYKVPYLDDICGLRRQHVLTIS